LVDIHLVDADAPEQLTIFDDLRRENIEARDELDRLKQLHAKQLAITVCLVVSNSKSQSFLDVCLL